MISIFGPLLMTIAPFAPPGALAGTPAVSAIGVDEDKALPAEWRESARPELRKAWDRLEGKPAPELSGLSEWMQTESRSWGDLRGKVVLIDMWATWCGPCLKSIPKLKDLHTKYADDGLVILGVHSKRGVEKMKPFVKNMKLPYAFAADAKRTLGAQLGVQYIPCYFAVDRSGTMRVAGANRSKLEEIVKTLLKEPYDGEVAEETSAPETGWPEHVEKKLYAKNDLRGKAAPRLEVEMWLTAEPSRRGKAVLIDFWATWCGPCKKAIPELNQLQEEFSDDLVVIGVSDESPDTVRSFMDGTEMAYAQAIDQNGAMKDKIGVKGIPHVLLIDTAGIVRWQGFPMGSTDPLTADVVRRVLDMDSTIQKRRKAEGRETAAR